MYYYYVPFWVFRFIVLFCVLFVCNCVLYCTVMYCTVLLPPAVNPIAVNKYIIYHKCIGFRHWFSSGGPQHTNVQRGFGQNSVPVHTVKVWGGGRGLAPQILNLDMGWS